MTIYGVQLVLAIDVNVSKGLIINNFLTISLSLLVPHSLSSLSSFSLSLLLIASLLFRHCTSTCPQIVLLLVTPPVKMLARKPSNVTLVYRLGSLHLLFIDHLLVTLFLNEKYPLRMCSIFYFIHSFTHSFIYWFIFLSFFPCRLLKTAATEIMLIQLV